MNEKNVPKYEFTGKQMKLENGRTLHEVVALKDFGNIEAGDIGGFIEKESNLSHDGDSWVYSGGQVYGDSKVHQNGEVYGFSIVVDSEVRGNAQVGGNARVTNGSLITEDAKIEGNAVIDDSMIGSKAEISGNAVVRNEIIVSDVKIDYNYNDALSKSYDERYSVDIDEAVERN